MMADDKTMFQYPSHGARIGKEFWGLFTWQDGRYFACVKCDFYIFKKNKQTRKEINRLEFICTKNSRLAENFLWWVIDSSQLCSYG